MPWIFVPPWGMRAVAAAGASLLILLILSAVREKRNVPLRRRWVSLALRTAVLLALLFVALNPTAFRPKEKHGKPRLIVLVDTSASMSSRDVFEKSRLQAALDILAARPTIEALRDNFEIDGRGFDRQSRALEIEGLTPAMATGDASDIGGSLTRSIRDLEKEENQAGVLLVSDGRPTAEGCLEAAQLALAASVPLWTWCLGGEVARKDLWIEVPAAETLVFARSEVALNAQLRQTGLPGQSFSVELLLEGKSVGSQELLPDPSGAAPARFVVTAPEAGEHRYIFRVRPDPTEADLQNNERAVFVRVVGEKVRVLLAEGQPHWDSKFLVQCLKRDPHVDLTAVHSLGPERHFAVISSSLGQRREEANLFPRTPESMMQHDLILFGRGCESFFDAGTEELLTRFVADQAGGIIFARGKAYGGRFFPLAKFEPITWGQGSDPSVRLRVTHEGRDSPIFEIGTALTIDDLLLRLPVLDQASWTLGEKPLAVVLARAASEAEHTLGGKTILMAYQRYGQGKVLTFNASGLWRWAFREKGPEEEELAYSRFWSAILRWMLAGSDFAPGAEVALRSARRSYNDEQTLQFLITTKGLDTKAYRPRLVIQEGPDAQPGSSDAPTAEAEKGRGIEIEPKEQPGGGFTAEAGPLPPASYRVTLHSNIGKPEELSMTVDVVSASTENHNLSADPSLMRRMAEVSGGKALENSEIPVLAGVIERWRASRESALETSLVWHSGWLLWAMLLVLALEWFIRRRVGLV